MNITLHFASCDFLAANSIRYHQPHNWNKVLKTPSIQKIVFFLVLIRH